MHIGRFLLVCLALSACEGASNKVVPEDVGPESRFGSAVAASDDFYFVGSSGFDGSGTVFVFSPSNRAAPVASIRDFQGAAGDEFGAALDFNDGELLVGAPINEIDGTLGGRAFIYHFDPGQNLWLQEEDLQALSPSDLDYFGTSVALHGEIAVVGSPGDDERGSNAGAAFVFRHGDAGWSFVAKLLASNAAEGDRFGESVATDGERVLVGSPYAFSGDSRPGAGYLFTPTGSSFEQTTILTPKSLQSEQGFGSAVAIGGEFAFVGAPGPGNPDAPGGTVTVFDLASGESAPSQTLTSGSNVAESGFGAAIDCNDSYLIVGSQRPVGDHPGPGSADLFTLQGSSWTLVGRLDGSADSKADGYGRSVAISSALAAVGAAGDAGQGPNAGAAYFYSAGSGIWK